ncbi:hypothetical protein L9F63_024720 [Diploptera punctata]|uniref:Isopropylmalate dehydrogenase-like domain-containing protein n=1 Tax=Diploptera punctata TaxID=6984 RepID=A0AAD7ZF59_DIPPU|nr:hypothetical protein L9F63_024720 [Diploptera punctata]
MLRCGGIPVDFDIVQYSENEDRNSTLRNAILSVRRNGVAMKGNIENPNATIREISHNVILRNELDLYANVIECKSYPGVHSKHKNVDMVIVRMNTEGEYNMLEHESLRGMIESLRIITRKNSERVALFCFEYSRKYGRKKITSVHNSKLMSLADGLFLETTKNIAKNYPDIEHNDMNINECCAKLISEPSTFDVLLMPNLYGNIISHIVCGLMRGVGLISGKNFGDNAAVFETGARHAGWELAGKNIANPCSMLNASVDMLEYLGLYYHAYVIHRAIDKTINKDHIHTQDLGGKATSVDVVENIMKYVHKATEHVTWPYPTLEELEDIIKQE